MVDIWIFVVIFVIFRWSTTFFPIICIVSRVFLIYTKGVWSGISISQNEIGPQPRVKNLKRLAETFECGFDVFNTQVAMYALSYLGLSLSYLIFEMEIGVVRILFLVNFWYLPSRLSFFFSFLIFLLFLIMFGSILIEIYLRIFEW